MVSRTYSQSNRYLLLVTAPHPVRQNMDLYFPLPCEQLQSGLEHADVRLDPEEDDMLDVVLGEEGRGGGENHGEFGLVVGAEVELGWEESEGGEEGRGGRRPWWIWRSGKLEMVVNDLEE